MPRPTKEFLDYFPMYCRGDERTDLLKAKCGMTGFGIYISLLIKLYGERGYYLNWNERICCIFSASSGVSEKTVTDTVSLLVDVGLFDRNIYEKYGVLTSREIQENYLYAIAKRKNKGLDKRYDLVSAEETPVSVTETLVSDTESTQRKENKNIKNKTIKKEREIIQIPSSTPAPRGEMCNVILTEEEYCRLGERFSNADALIDKLSLYLASTGKSYSSHYATLLRWAESEKDKQPPPKDSGSSYDIDEFFEAALRHSRDKILDD